MTTRPTTVADPPGATPAPIAASPSPELTTLHDGPSHERLLSARPRVEAAIAALRRGDFVVVADESATGAALLACAAVHASTERVNALVALAGGVVACTVDDDRGAAMDLHQIPQRRCPAEMPRYAVSVEAAVGVSTGISAADRAATIAALADPRTRADDLVRPGHIMPILVGSAGVLRRPYAAETAHELVRMSGLTGGAAVSHVLRGEEELRAGAAAAFAEAQGYPYVSARDVVVLRSASEELVVAVEAGVIDTVAGTFRAEIYESQLDAAPHVALILGDLVADEAAPAPPPLVRIHSQCLTGDVLHSERCDCGQQLHASLERIRAAGRGVLLYLSQEGRGIGLIGKIQAYALQDSGLDTVDANLQLGFAVDQRDYAVAAQMLRRQGLRRVRLMTNNPDKVQALQRFGIDVVERVGLEVAAGSHNAGYLRTKRERLGHALGAVADDQREH